MHEIEQLTLWELNDLMAYWKDYPPTHVLVAAYLMGGGMKSRPSRRQSGLRTDMPANSKLNFNNLAHEVALAGGSVNGKLPEAYRLT